LIDFTTYTFPTYKVDPFHRFVAHHLDKVVRGETDKLMIFASPQSGKSELVSVRFPAFWLAQRSQEPIIITSYGSNLAQSKSRHSRAIVESSEFAELFPDIKTNPESRAVDLWELARPARSQVRAAGVGAGLTGHPAALGIIDDPVESWAVAQSERQRDVAWEWYQGTFRTRVWENGAIVIIMTRWHPDDLAGKLLQEQGDEWTILRLPALAEEQDERDFINKSQGLPTGQPDPLGRKPGEPLTPSRFSREALLKIKKDVGSMVWAAEYQGAPVLAEGNLFKRDWFYIVERVPEDIKRRARYWDFASLRDGKSKTSGVLLSIDRQGIIYIEDVAVGGWTPNERNNVIRLKAAQDHERYGNYGRMWFEQEPGSAGKEVAESMVRLLEGYSVRPDRPTGEKDVRLEPFRAQAEGGNIRLLRGAWNEEYINELCAVPNGMFRDQADATAGAYNRLAGRHITVATFADKGAKVSTSVF